jgi:ubiquinone/menaquinone biosynthesis C-methylase UbiE
VVAATTRENEFKRRLVQEMDLRPAERVLDIGCGTGTLAVMLKRAEPSIELLGVDGDPDVLRAARAKAAAAGLDIEFNAGLAGELSLPESSVDKVASTLVFHHLSTSVKRAALTDILRTLRPGGQFYLADLSGVPAALAKTLYLPFRLFDGLENTADNFYGRLPRLMSEMGFDQVEQRARFLTIVGPVSIISAHKAG